LFRPERAVDRPVRNNLGGQRTIAAGPTHVALNALAERLRRDADLQRAEPAVPADVLRDRLVDRRPARPAAGEAFAGNETAHRVVVAVALATHARRRVVDAADD